jgi:hypothetical protein
MENFKQKLEEIIAARLNDGKVSADIAIDAMLDFYKQNRVKADDEIENDMLLFQYGILPSGKLFYFDLTRQIADPNDDEYFQIHLTLNYKPDEIGQIESYNRWSVNDITLDEFKSVIKKTEGYKRAIAANPFEYNIELDKT